MYGETQTRINEKNATAALACGVYFNDIALADISLEFIISNLDSTNVLDYFHLADSFDYGLHTRAIQDACLSFICSHDPDNLVSIFSHASHGLIEKVVSSDSLCVRGEFERYRLITQILDELTDCSNDTDEKYDQTVPDLRSSDHSADQRIGNHKRAMKILENSVIYANLSFEELKIVQKEGRVSSQTLMSALWNQRQQEHDIKNFNSNKKDVWPEALLKSPSHKLFVPPMSDTDRMNNKDIADHILCPPVHQHQALETRPPFRFQVEFQNLHQVGDRVYSELFWHAGSHWRMYLQMPMQRTEDKIGLYLQRIMTGGSIDANGGSSNSSRTSERYTDPRPAVSVWFRMFLFVSHTNCYLLESCPDTFKDNQSWGWQCQTLHRELLGRQGLGGRPSLKVSVILGVLDAPN